MSVFMTNDFNRTGRAGIITDIGKGNGPGTSRAIKPGHNNRDRNSDIKGKSNINRGLRSGDISNRCESSKDNTEISNTREKRNTNMLRENQNGEKQSIDSTYSNGTTPDMTTQVTWSSSSTAVAIRMEKGKFEWRIQRFLH